MHLESEAIRSISSCTTELECSTACVRILCHVAQIIVHRSATDVVHLCDGAANDYRSANAEGLIRQRIDNSCWI